MHGLHRYAPSALLTLALVACGGGGGSTDTVGQTTGDPPPATTTEAPGTTTGTTAGATVGETGGSITGGQTTGEPGTSTGTTVEPATTDAPGTSSGTTAEPATTDAPGTSTGAGLCDDFEQPGCLEKGCPEGQKCDISGNGECVPSSCDCDPRTGDILCTADCNGGVCVPAACDPVACNLFCEFGFKKDAQGCEICECNEAPPDCGCLKDADCVKVTPGCCGCNEGGKEQAVAQSCVDDLPPCPFPPGEFACPQVYLCTEAQAACVGGQCVLADI